MSYTFPKDFRLRSKSEFSAIRKGGRVRVFGELFVMSLIDSTDCGSHLKLGISVPKRYGNAVLRNRFRRVVREVVRHDAELKSLPFRMIVGPNLRSNTLRWPCLDGIKRSFQLLKCDLNSQ